MSSSEQPDRRAFLNGLGTVGLPAASVPCGVATNGLPIGLQIVGPPWGEESVLRLAYAFEQATDWQTRRPPL